MNISIIIVNYDTTDYLYKCIDSIRKYTSTSDVEILVVDNNSPNRDIEICSLEYPSVKFFFREINDGFGAGCNYGAKKAKGKYLFFVNPDIIFKSDISSVFYNFLENNKNVSMCSGLHENENGGLIYSFNSFPNIRSEFREAFYWGYIKHINNLLSKKEIALSQPFEIDYALGALIFLRKIDFDNIGGFDERFFLYYEDVDLGQRLKKLGKAMCIPSERVFHSYNSSVRKKNDKWLHIYHLNRSKMIYMYKYYNIVIRNLTRIIMIIGSMLRIAYLPFNSVHKGKKWRDFKSMFLGILIFFKVFKIKSLQKFNN